MFCGRWQSLHNLRLVVIYIVTIYVSSLFLRYFRRNEDFIPTKPAENFNRDFDMHVIKFPNAFLKKRKMKNILMWTTFFNGWSWLTYAQNAMQNCPVACRVTNDRSAILDADAVLFHASDLWLYGGFLATVYSLDIQLPTYRHPDQVWVLFSMEPMSHLWGKLKSSTFNWTMFYRRESTVYTPFSYWYKNYAQEIKNKSNVGQARDFYKEKRKFAATLVSNCKDQIQRYRIIRDLQKYVEVDDFGLCSGRLICPEGMSPEDCGKKELTHYKFYLAFENSYCRDYVSEKFWNALDRRQIPVIAAPDYNLELLPRGSYLNVFDFPSIKHLAERMIEIGQNETLYNSFFDWMDEWHRDDTDRYCRLCEHLHSDMQAQSYVDMEGWIRNDICFENKPWDLIKGLFDRVLFDLGFT